LEKRTIEPWGIVRSEALLWEGEEGPRKVEKVKGPRFIDCATVLGAHQKQTEEKRKKLGRTKT